MNFQRIFLQRIVARQNRRVRLSDQERGLAHDGADLGAVARAAAAEKKSVCDDAIL